MKKVLSLLLLPLILSGCTQKVKPATRRNPLPAIRKAVKVAEEKHIDTVDMSEIISEEVGEEFKEFREYHDLGEIYVNSAGVEMQRHITIRTDIDMGVCYYREEEKPYNPFGKTNVEYTIVEEDQEEVHLLIFEEYDKSISQIYHFWTTGFLTTLSASNFEQASSMEFVRNTNGDIISIENHNKVERYKNFENYNIFHLDGVKWTFEDGINKTIVVANYENKKVQSIIESSSLWYRMVGDKSYKEWITPTPTHYPCEYDISNPQSKYEKMAVDYYNGISTDLELDFNVAQVEMRWDYWSLYKWCIHDYYQNAK